MLHIPKEHMCTHHDQGYDDNLHLVSVERILLKPKHVQHLRRQAYTPACIHRWPAAGTHPACVLSWGWTHPSNGLWNHSQHKKELLYFTAVKPPPTGSAEYDTAGVVTRSAALPHAALAAGH